MMADDAVEVRCTEIARVVPHQPYTAKTRLLELHFCC